ncbi:hypothetical protein CPHO_08665 [Corynebacterium phocae]|uniref:SCP domain-containing protein n=1 Tax=Corynebacterium phocae TaxID=161895 RepID=A0A1L7D489_9CORY|nr:hypothetical protein [Corynebacterium phocae]APT92948.1 hypothetical protein CPHO_08665 [Corynebacterium phocae]KAA8723281.1 hypothetical protein F4V58_08170 [Corynebacterium phocae]
MNNSRRISAVLAASALTLAGTAGSTAGAATPDFAQLSSTSSIPQISLPDQALDLVDAAGIELPAFVWQSSNKLEQGLRGATESHLEKQGHTKDARAYDFARDWAGQAARGEVKFYGRAGDGTNHLENGSGNVYRFKRTSAVRRLAWLQRDVPVQTSPVSKGYGVATSTDGDYIYVVEYFLDK